MCHRICHNDEPRSMLINMRSQEYLSKLFILNIVHSFSVLNYIGSRNIYFIDRQITFANP